MDGMELRYPPADVDDEPTWWAPLRHAADRAVRSGLRRRLDQRDFEARGCVVRAERPPVFVYRHRTTWRELYVDGAGRAYRYTPVRGQRGGRFTECDVRRAVLGVFVWPAGEVTQPADAELRVLRRRGHLALIACS
jgi:hypothetical protein